jgi:hypothetical protein
MIKGLYGVIFGTPAGDVGGSVVVFSDGRVQGGDVTYFYDGVIRSSSGGVVEADVRVQKYQETGESVFGNLSDFSLKLSGQAVGSSFVMSGHVVGDTSARITVQCRKLAD